MEFPQNGRTCVWRFGHLADACKKQADPEVNMLVIVGWPGTQFGDSNTMSNITDFQILHRKSVIFDVVLNFLNKPPFVGWPTDY